MKSMNKHPTIRNIAAAFALTAGAASLAGCGENGPGFEANNPSYQITPAQYNELSTQAKEAVSKEWETFSPRNKTSDGNYSTSETNGWLDTTKSISIDADSIDGSTEVVLRVEKAHLALVNKEGIDGKTVADQIIDFRTSKKITLKNTDANTYSTEKFADIKGGKLLEQFLEDEDTFLSVVTTSGPKVVGDTIATVVKPNEVKYDLTEANIARGGGDVAKLVAGTTESVIDLVQKQLSDSIDYGYKVS